MTTAHLSVTTINTTLVEDDEYFKAILSISDGSDRVVVGVDTAFVTIFDSTGECAVIG